MMVQEDKVDTPRSQTKAPRRRLALFIIIGAIGLILICVTSGLIAFSPANGLDQRPKIIAALFTATPTLTPSATPTAIPIATTLPTRTASPSTTPFPTETLVPTATSTPTPLVTPDSREREFVVPILMYHYVSVPPSDADVYRLDLSVTPANFRQQMQWLKDNGYHTISLYHLVYALNIGWPPLPERPVILTFDDGYRDNYENAFPILQEMGFTGTFFILTGSTDRQESLYMTWDMLREMYAGGMSVELHGREHFEYSGRDDDWLVFNLLGPAQTIEVELGYQPRFLAYVSGQYDDQTIRVAHSAGFWAAVTTKHGALHAKDNLYELTRVRIRGDWNVAQFSAVIDGFY